MKQIISLLLTFSLPFTGLATGIPVFDASNLSQNLTTAFNSVRQVAQQAQSYMTQLQQLTTAIKSYENMILNSTGIAEAAKIYQEATQTISELQGLYSQFSNPSQLMGQLNQFQSVQYWTSIDTSAYQPQTAGSDAQKKADDAWVQSLAKQQQLLQADASNLQKLQTSASTTQGQLEALQAASQLAAQTNMELMEIRALMLSEQQALVARQQTLANNEAMQQAASDKFLGVGSQYKAAPETTFHMP
jgi:type IV secretion system protein TrbJ